RQAAGPWAKRVADRDRLHGNLLVDDASRVVEAETTRDASSTGEIGHIAQARTSPWFSKYAVPNAAASTRSSCSPTGNVVISSNSACCSGATSPPFPFSRNVPFATDTANACTRAALSRDCVSPCTLPP